MVKNIIFDFDGVILDSIPIKTDAFETLFKDFPADQVEQLLAYHLENGGLSRYVKIRYFFETLRHEPIKEEEVAAYAHRYSLLTKKALCNPKFLIDDTMEFVRKNHGRYRMHIASGADDADLKYICKKLKIDAYFISIDGAPTNKGDIVRNIIEVNNYKKEETILIGDSINDYEAAERNKLQFFGYNNDELRPAHPYVNSFREAAFGE